MKKTILFLQAAVVGLLAACNQPSDEEQLRDEIQYVNPFIGTGFHGHTFPGRSRDHRQQAPAKQPQEDLDLHQQHLTGHADV